MAKRNRLARVVAQSTRKADAIRAASLLYAQGITPAQTRTQAKQAQKILATPEADSFDHVSAAEFTAPRYVEVRRKLTKTERRREAKRKRREERRAARAGKPSIQDEWRAKYEAHINSLEWKLFRLTVFASRGTNCEACGLSDSGQRHVHHLHYRNLGHEKLEDVKVLCEVCHQKAHPRKRIMRRCVK